MGFSKLRLDFISKGQVLHISGVPRDPLFPSSLAKNCDLIHIQQTDVRPSAKKVVGLPKNHSPQMPSWGLVVFS